MRCSNSWDDNSHLTNEPLTCCTPSVTAPALPEIGDLEVIEPVRLIASERDPLIVDCLTSFFGSATVATIRGTACPTISMGVCCKHSRDPESRRRLF
jgi:hypothetical protein